MHTRTQVKYHIYRWFWLIQKRGQLMYAKIGVTVKFSTHLPSSIPQPPQTCWSLIYALRSLSHTHIIHLSQCTSNSLYKIGLYTYTHYNLSPDFYFQHKMCITCSFDCVLYVLQHSEVLQSTEKIQHAVRYSPAQETNFLLWHLHR